MKRINQFINRRVQLTYEVKKHHHKIAGVITTVGKSYILFIPNDGEELPIKRNKIITIEP
jgi:hypothetical protein